MWIARRRPQVGSSSLPPGWLPGTLAYVSDNQRATVARPTSGVLTEGSLTARRGLPSAGEAEVLRAAARAAEDSGDFEGALRLVRRLPDRPGARDWLRELRTAAGFPASASAELACWLTHPALRWAQERPAGDLLERHARLMLTTLGLRAPDRVGRIAAVAATDPVVVDAGLFDGGLFAGFLAEAISPGLLSRAGPVGTWSEHPASVWQLRGHCDDFVMLHDLWTDLDVRTLPWHSSRAMATGALVYGRLVPVVGDVPLTFALAPVSVDARCAARVLRTRQRVGGPEERLRAVARFRRREAAGAGGAG